MANVTLCRYLYIDPPSCSRSYADGLGSTYDTAQGIYIAIVVVLFLCLEFLTYRIFSKKKFYPLGKLIKSGSS